MKESELRSLIREELKKTLNESNNQSSIDWLIDQLDIILELYPSERELVNKAADQAKKKHQQEIEDAYWDGGQDVPSHISSVEKYYKDKF